MLENDAEYKRWKIKRLNASRIKRDRQAQQRVRLELESLRNKSMNEIGPVENIKMAQVKTVPAAAKAPRKSSPQAQPQTQSAPSRSFDMPRFSGGGAMDPVSALIGIALGGGALFGRRKKK